MDSGSIAGTVIVTTSSGVASSTFTVAELSTPYSVSVSGSASITVSTLTTYTVTLLNLLGVAYTSSVSATMNLYGSDNTATLGGTTTVSSTTSGIATFSISISRVGNFYLYPTVSGSTLVEQSLYVTVTATIPTSLTLTNPGTVGIGKTFSVTVTLIAGTNNVISLATSITLALSPGTLSGYSATSTSAGTVTFSGLYIATSSSTGTQTLTASSATYALLTSVTFSATITSTLIFTMTSEPYVLATAGTYVYSLYLSTAPLSIVTVTLTSSTTSIITVSPSTLTFTVGNYGTAQTVTLTIHSAGVTAAQNSVTISHALTSTDSTYTTAKALFYGCDSVSSTGTLTVTVLATTVPGTILLTGTFYAVEGASSTYNMKLSTAPGANVVVSQTCPSVLTCTPSSLTFTSSTYNTYQTITVATATGAAGSSQSVTDTIIYTITSTDTLYQYALTSEINYIIIAASSASSGITQSSYPVMNDGTSKTATFTLSLKTTPTSTVTITLTTSDSSITTSPSTLTFTAANSAQTVTITYIPTAYPTSMMHYFTVHHASSSSDANYQGTSKYSIAQDLPVYIINPCTYGQYFSSSSYTCVSCPVDYSCPTPIALTLCSSGQYSPSGIFTCLPCPPGYACNPTGSGGQVACASGYYSLGSASACIQCAAGTACVSNAAPPADCPLGTYSAAGATSCTLLTGSNVGFPDATPTVCSAGTIPSAMRTHCENCPPGHYCSDPTTRTITPCAVGYYAAAGASSCTQCPAGSACSRTENSGTCPEGYYSLAGQGSCVECPPGSYCTVGIINTCTGGYKVGQNSCAEGLCPAGSYCILGLPPMPCPPGYISNAGDITCTACGSGYYQDGNACTQCPAGFFCATPVSPPIACFFGTYSTAGSTSCTSCTVGYTCGQGSSSPTQIPCPPGFDCSTVYTPITGISVIWPAPCAAGTYSTGGTFGCQPCPAGYYCPGATWDYQKFPCPPGQYCAAGSSTPANCAAFTYNPN